MQTFSKVAGEYLVEVEVGKTDLISLLKRLSEKELPLSHDGFTNFLVWLRYKLLEITEVEVGEDGNFTSLKTYGLDIKDYKTVYAVDVLTITDLVVERETIKLRFRKV